MGVAWGLRVEVEVPGDERTSTPAVFKDLGRCLALPAAAVRRLSIVVGVICSSVWRAMSLTRTPDALVLDIESCDRFAGCPGCGVIAQGHGRVVVEVIDAPWAVVPARFRWFKRRWICRETTCQIATFTEQNNSVCSQGASGRPGDPLGDPTVAFRGSHHCRIGPPVRNHVEHRVVPYQAVSASRI